MPAATSVCRSVMPATAHLMLTCSLINSLKATLPTPRYLLGYFVMYNYTQWRREDLLLRGGAKLEIRS